MIRNESRNSCSIVWNNWHWKNIRQFLTFCRQFRQPRSPESNKWEPKCSDRVPGNFENNAIEDQNIKVSRFSSHQKRFDQSSYRLRYHCDSLSGQNTRIHSRTIAYIMVTSTYYTKWKDWLKMDFSVSCFPTDEAS